MPHGIAAIVTGIAAIVMGIAAPATGVPATRTGIAGRTSPHELATWRRCRARWPYQRNRRNRRLLLTTNTLENAIAAPATMGDNRPVIASGIAATL